MHNKLERPYTRMPMFKTQTVSFQSEPLRSVWSQSKSRLVFITEISTPKSRFVALHYQDVRSNSELHLEFCRYGIINVWCDKQSMTYVGDCFIILGPNHCWTSTLKSIIPRQKKKKKNSEFPANSKYNNVNNLS